MQILALVTDAFGGRGGIAQYNRDFLGALALCDYVSSVTVLPRLAPDPVAAPAGVHQIPPRRGRIAYGLAALRVALSQRIDVVYCGHLLLVPLALLIARISRAKLVIQMYGIDAWQPPARLHRIAVDAADLVLCISRYTRARVLNWTTIAPERVPILPVTVSEAYTPGDGSALRALWGLEGKLVMLTVSRMDASERYKGHDRVIAALAHLLARGLDVIYVVVGEGDDRARIESLAREKGVADRVHFKGAIGRRELIEACRMADLFVMPSTGEGFGIAFLEAMASGTPAVGLNVAGARDALADGELGTAVSEVDLPSALERLLAAPKPDPNVIAAAVRARFGRQTFDTQVAAIFAKFVGPHE